MVVIALRRSKYETRPPGIGHSLSHGAAALVRLESAEPLKGHERSRPRLDVDVGWREPPEAPPPIKIFRLKHDGPEVRELSTAATPEYIAIDIALRYTELTLWAGDECVHRGRFKPGMVLVTDAGLPARAEFGGPCDVLRLLVPIDLFAKISQDDKSGPYPSPSRINPAFPDQAIERLAWSMLKVEDLDSATVELYVNAITVAILARLLSPNSHRISGECPAEDGLVKWRLKRVLNFVETNLAKPLTLEMLSECAGLSRMYFAAQFRAATGIRPHEYLIRRRVERAAQLLRETTMPLVEVALNVGFQTQAHFTTVFRRFTDETPKRWRQSHRKEPVAGNL